MGCRVVYVLTHDSVGVGEDGPTHQPVEHLASLRVMPNLYVVRPRTRTRRRRRGGWRSRRTTGPTALVLSRQKLPVLPPSSVFRDGGVYRRSLRLGGRGGRPSDVVLIASGSEVSVALAARKLLGEEGVPARVVSMPCRSGSRSRRRGTGNRCSAVGSRARLRGGGGDPRMERYVGERGASVGIDRFGASAPADRIFRELGITRRLCAIARNRSSQRSGRSPGMKTNPLIALGRAGQSPWIGLHPPRDDRVGELARRIAEDGIRGVTSNRRSSRRRSPRGPTTTPDPCAGARRGRRSSMRTRRSSPTTSGLRDDVLRPVHDASHGDDGYVSLEVDPDLARDTKATIAPGAGAVRPPSAGRT